LWTSIAKTNSERYDTNDNQRIEIISRNESLNSYSLRNYGVNRRIRIVGVGGSIREGSFSTLAVKMVLDLSKNNYCAETNLVDLRQTKLPIYNPDDISHNNIQKMGHLLT
jgi:hypothetical protein